MIAFAMTLGRALAATAPAETIGPETSLPLQSSQSFSVAIGDAPDDGSIQTYNPPVFTWVYSGDNPWNMAGDLTPRIFRFQLSTNAGATFSSLYWNITTSNNCYNFLSPITNRDGSSYLGTSYWRVIYYAGDGQTILATGSVHNFTLSASATNWDRSMLANSNYLYSIVGQHPHFLFNNSNKSDVGNYLKNTSYWNSFSNLAVYAVGQSWWNNPSVYTNMNQGNSIQNTIQYMYSVALMYQMSSDPFWANQHPEQMFDLYVKQFIALDQMHQEAYTAGASAFQMFPMVADWLWPILSDTTRSNTVYAMEESVKYYVYEDWWYEDSGNYTTNFYNWNTRQVGYSSAFKTGNSHARYDVQPALMMCLCCWTNSAILRGLMDYPLNYSFAIKDYGRGDEGRSYNLNNFQALLNWGGDMVELPLLSAAHLERSSYFQRMMGLYCYSEPMNYRGTAEPWGDLGYGIGPKVQGAGLYANEYLMREIAAYSGNGAALKQAIRQDSNPDLTREFEWASAYYNSTPPTQVDWPSTAYIDPLWGYTVCGSHQPGDFSAFTNGVGFMTQARPGARMEHGNPTDGSLQLWAYGAQITGAGVGAYRKHPMYSSSMVFVDGIGVRGGVYANPVSPWYSRFTAFTNCDDFSYVSADTTKSYLLTNLVGAQFPYDYYFYYQYSTNARPYLTSMNRHILFPHKKYVVLYDTMTTSQPAHFQWLWHYLEPTGTVNTNACSFTYSCTNAYNGSNVTVYVVPFVNPSLMTLTNLAGANNAWINPFTGESYDDGQYTYLSEPRYNGSVWVYNKTATNNWHFGWVVYPVKWGGAAPTITRINDYSVRVQDADNDDTITIDSPTEPATYTLNLSGSNLGVHRLAPPSDLRVAP
ncbi:MAG TPA: hypothetical protein VG938_00995 [Verrucomicrobiae bacterium]|nr:hypothetical protein [Verrucomicrobiae bacterium]